MSTFLQVVELLLTNDDAKADYANNPSSFLDDHGLGSFDSTDVADAMGHAADALPISVAVLLDPDQGLDSAAELDLEAQGLSLDREPIQTDDLDPDLDPYGAGADVDFDAPESSDDTNGSVDTDGGATIDALGDLATPEIEDDPESDALETPAELDTGDYLTDVGFDLPGQDSPLETGQLEESGAGLSAEDVDDLDADLSNDLPDEFDLLD